MKHPLSIIWVIEKCNLTSVLIYQEAVFSSCILSLYSYGYAIAFNAGQPFSSQLASGLVISWQSDQLRLACICCKDQIEVHGFYWSVVLYNQHSPPSYLKIVWQLDRRGCLVLFVFNSLAIWFYILSHESGAGGRKKNMDQLCFYN